MPGSYATINDIVSVNVIVIQKSSLFVDSREIVGSVAECLAAPMLAGYHRLSLLLRKIMSYLLDRWV